MIKSQVTRYLHLVQFSTYHTEMFNDDFLKFKFTWLISNPRFSIFLLILTLRQYVSCVSYMHESSANPLGYTLVHINRCFMFSLFIDFRHYQCYKSQYRIITVFQLSKRFHQFLNEKKCSISFWLIWIIKIAVSVKIIEV